MAITNKEIMAGVIAKFPNVSNHSSKVGLELLTEKGYDDITEYEPNLVNDFFGLMLRVYLSIINISHAKNPLEEQDFGEYFDMPYGAITQRMAIDSVKPISPQYKNLKNGDSPDPFVVRKPNVSERFFPVNFDYASLITIPDDFQMKQIFIQENGFDTFMAGIMEGLKNGYVIQNYTIMRDSLNAVLNNKNHPPLPTQKIQFNFSDVPTDDEMRAFILTIKDIVSTMRIAPQTGAYNAFGYKSTQDISRLRLLVKPGLKNRIETMLYPYAYNSNTLQLPIKIVEVPDFGGLEPYKEEGFTTPLYPVYDKLGEQIGYSSTKGASEVEVGNDAVFWKDPNAGVYAMIADKGLVFTMRQNPYRVEPIRNPRGLYTNFWCSSPNNGVHVDMLYNWIAIGNF